MRYFRPGTHYVQPTLAVPIEFYRALERYATSVKEDLDLDHYDVNHLIHELIETKVKELEPWVWAEWKLKELKRKAEYRNELVDADTESYLKNLIASKPVSKE